MGLLHAWEDSRACINRVYFAERCGDRWKVTVHHARGLGFQYKWFIDYKGKRWTAEDVMSKLKSSGYCRATVGGGKLDRVWFVHPERPIARDLLEPTIENNRFYPE